MSSSGKVVSNWAARILDLFRQREIAPCRIGGVVSHADVYVYSDIPQPTDKPVAQ